VISSVRAGALVEARAKAIFQTLEAQSDIVILFDELDAFLLDRDSNYYFRQDTLFQFLTPGMLTKINGLREAEKSLFIIATNYANRIDPAIKRPGRIDHQYLLLPPDLGKRKEIIKTSFKEPVRFADNDVHEMASASVFLGYKEMVGAIGQPSSVTTALQLINALKMAQRSSSAKQYLAHLNGNAAFPDKEFIAMFKLAVEVGQQKEIIDEINSLTEGPKKEWDKIYSGSSILQQDLKL
jgi:hypothetical protein